MKKTKKLLILCVSLVFVQPFCTMLGMQGPVSEPDYIAESPMHHAAWHGDAIKFEELLKRGNVSQRVGPRGCYTPLYIAALKGHTDVAEALLAAGAPVDAVGFDGATPLYIAAQKGCVDVVKALLAAGARVDGVGPGGATPLHIATQKGCVDIVEALLAAGALVDAVTRAGATPLYIAAQKGYVDVVEALLAAGANVDIIRPDGATPLHIAAQEGRVDIVDRLLVAGANVNAVTSDGATPLHIAVSHDHVGTVARLLATRVQSDYALTSNKLNPTYSVGHSGIIRRRLFDKAREGDALEEAFEESANRKSTAGALLDIVSCDGSPLVMAVRRGHLEIVRRLLIAGASTDGGVIDPVDTPLDTPLYLAAEGGYLEIVRRLLGAGAKNPNGGHRSMPLAIAIRNGHAEIVKLLSVPGAVK